MDDARMISEDLRAAALLLEHGYRRAADRVLGNWGMMLPRDPAPAMAAANSDSDDGDTTGAAGEEDPPRSDTPPAPLVCATPDCGAPLRRDNRSGACRICRAQGVLYVSPGASGKACRDCGRALRRDNQSGICYRCYDPGLAERAPAPPPEQRAVCLTPGCLRRLKEGNRSGYCQSTELGCRAEGRRVLRVNAPPTARVCEGCGAGFESRGPGRRRTLCDVCRKMPSVGAGDYNGALPTMAPGAWRSGLSWEMAMDADVEECAALDAGLAAAGWEFDPAADRWVLRNGQHASAGAAM